MNHLWKLVLRCRRDYSCVDSIHYWVNTILLDLECENSYQLTQLKTVRSPKFTKILSRKLFMLRDICTKSRGLFGYLFQPFFANVAHRGKFKILTFDIVANFFWSWLAAFADSMIPQYKIRTVDLSSITSTFRADRFQATLTLMFSHHNRKFLLAVETTFISSPDDVGITFQQRIFHSGNSI